MYIQSSSYFTHTASDLCVVVVVIQHSKFKCKTYLSLMQLLLQVTNGSGLFMNLSILLTNRHLQQIINYIVTSSEITHLMLNSCCYHYHFTHALGFAQVACKKCNFIFMRHWSHLSLSNQLHLTMSRNVTELYCIKNYVYRNSLVC